MGEIIKVKYNASCIAALGNALSWLILLSFLLAGLSVESNHVIGEVGSSITVGCTYSAKYRYVFFPHCSACVTLGSWDTGCFVTGSLSWAETDSHCSRWLPLWLPVDRASVKKWCRSGDWSSCRLTDGEGSFEDSSVAISDDRIRIFRVTLKKLQLSDAAWYLCVAGQHQIGVHVEVTPRTTTSRFLLRQRRVLPSVSQLCLFFFAHWEILNLFKKVLICFGFWGTGTGIKRCHSQTSSPVFKSSYWGRWFVCAEKKKSKVLP